jgi:hypothetical protein
MTRKHQRHTPALERVAAAIREWALSQNIVLLDEQAKGFAAAALDALQEKPG